MPARVNRSVVRESNFAERGRAIVVRLREGGNYIDVREKESRLWHSVTIREVFWAAVKNTAREIRERKNAERQARRKAKKGA